MLGNTSHSYSLSDFSYEFPAQLIALYPRAQRTDSRLLCLNKTTGGVTHKTFRDIIDFINPGDLLVLNDTQVIPARLFTTKLTGGKVEVLIERILDEKCVLAYLKPSKSLKLGAQLLLENGIHLEVQAREDDLFQLAFVGEFHCILDLLNTRGHIPLPPYLHRPDQPCDWERYQTVFASSPGAIAAPTAGLHFDQLLLDQLQTKGVNLAFITLHVGSGTFKPIRTKRIEDHPMHNEYVTVTSAVCDKIKEIRQRGKRVIAVGTTVVRGLETAAITGRIEPFTGDTRLFIYPGFQFHCVDALITNFHLPQSTLLMLVCAFAGYEHTMKAYQQAITHSYRLFSYGDALWVN